MNSTELRQKIDSTQSDITSKQLRLDALPQEKARVLHDDKKLRAIETEADELPTSIARLHERQRLLALELTAAFATEAAARIPIIEGEQRALATRITERRATFVQGVETLLELIRADTPDRVRWAELQAEAGYLVEAYGTGWPQVPAAVALHSHDIQPLESAFRTSHWVLTAGHEWTVKAEAIRAEKNAVAVAKADEHRARPRGMVTMNVGGASQ